MRTLKIDKDDVILVAIDYQEKLLPAMKNPEELVETVVKLIKGTRVLWIPIIFTQQYTKGLGKTVEAIETAATEELFDGYIPETKFEFVEKKTFSAMEEPDFAETLRATGKKTVILCGIEAHICVQQTALDLIDAGYRVYVVTDATASRNNNDKKYSQRRMSEAGAIITTYEAIIYEMLGGAGEPGFKQISQIVK